MLLQNGLGHAQSVLGQTEDIRTYEELISRMELCGERLLIYFKQSGGEDFSGTRRKKQDGWEAKFVASCTEYD